VTDRLITAAELAEYVGFKPATIQDWVQNDNHPLRSRKIGGRHRFYLAEALEQLNAAPSNPPLGVVE
jgi:hypothetical protein